MKRLFLALAIIALTCFAFAPPPTPVTYYVDTASTHGGDGTTTATTGANRAWDTIADVNGASFSAGDSVLFNRGCTWREQLVPPDSGSAVGGQITFGGYGTGDDPIIMNSEAKNSTGDWTDDTGNIWYTHITNHVDVGHIATTSASTPTILGDKKNTKAGCVNAGDFFFDHTSHNLYVYCTQNPATEYSGYIECAYGEVAGYGSAIGISSIDYITIDGIEVKYCGAHGIQLATTTGVIVQNCKVSYCGGSYLTGTTRYGNGIESWGSIATATIQHNDVSYCFDEGITLQDDATIANINKTNITVHGNIVDYCGRGFSYSQDATGTCATSDLTISGNTFSNNGLGWSGIGNAHGEGMVMSRGNGTMATTVVSGNTIDTCASGADPNGYGMELLGIAADILRNKITGCYNNVVRFTNKSTYQCAGTFAYNLVYGNSATAHLIFIYTNTGALNIYNNVLYKSTAGASNLIRINTGCSGVVVKNNIVACSAAGDTSSLIVVWPDSTATSDYNLWWKPDDQKIWDWIDTEYTKSQFATYKAAKSQDANSPTPADPLFVTAGSDFHLQSTSPCINAGVDVGLTEDYEGNPVPWGNIIYPIIEPIKQAIKFIKITDDTVDIGAYEKYPKRNR